MTLFQATIDFVDLGNSSSVYGSGIGDGIVLTFWLGVVVLVLIAALYISRNLYQRKERATGGSLATVLLRVRLPRFLSEEGNKAPELRMIQEGIAVAETFFSSLGGLKAQRGLKAWWKGRTDHVTFEIVAHGGVVYFYIGVPPVLEAHVVQQINAQFPNADVVREEDYNIFSHSGTVLGSYMTLKRENLFPIKTFRTLEADPLNALVNTMAKIPEGDGAAIQVTMRSAKAGWRKKSARVATNMHRGATLKQALRVRKFRRGSRGHAGSMILGKKQDESMNTPQRQMSQKEQEMVKMIEDKASKAGVDVNVRIVVSSPNVGTAQATLNDIMNAFSQYNIYQFGNSFQKSVPRNPKRIISDFIYRNYVDRYGFVLNTEEMASLWHPPLPGMDSTNIDWLDARKSGAPPNVAKEGIILGVNQYRGKDTVIHMKEKDRQRHMYIIGKSGSGKSTLIQDMVYQDIQDGKGVCVVDPHGDLVETLLGQIPKERIDDVVVFSPYDRDMPVGLNMLEAPNEEMRDFAVQEMVSIFYKLFPPEMIGPMFEHTMRNVMLTLMADVENPGTIAEIPRMITDEAFQKEWIKKVKDPVVRAYWEKEVANTSDFHKSEMFGYLTSKVGRFVEDEMMRNIIGQSKSGFSMREIMDQEKILFLDLSKGKTGEVNSNLLGLIIVTKLQMAAMARADMAEESRKDFYLYIDEFQNFVTPSIATILSEARKYKLDLILAHQYMGQVVDKGDTQIKDAILGNVGSMFVSRIGPEDVETFEKIFTPTFTGTDLINSDMFTWYVKMIVDNTQVNPFTMKGRPPRESNPELAKKIRQLSRMKYGRPRASVSAEIMKRTQIGVSQPPPPAPPPAR